MTIELAFVCSAVGVIISLLTFQRNGKKEVREDVTGIIELKTQLTYISRGIDDIKLADIARENELKETRANVTKLEYEVRDINKTLERVVDKINLE